MFAFNWFNGLRFSRKLIVLLLPCFVGFLGLGGWSAYANKVTDGVRQQVDTAYKVRGEVMASALISLHYGAAVENQIPDTIVVKNQELRKIQEQLTGLKAWVSMQDNAPLDKSYTELLQQVKRILEMPAKPGEGAPEEAELLGDISTGFNKVLQEHIDNLSLHYGQIRKNFDLLNIGVIVVGLLVLGVVLVVTLRVVLNPLGGDPKDVAQVVNTMASGNFSMHPHMSPPAGSLLANAYQMQSSLRDMIAKVKGQANQLEDVARNLAVAARQITENVNHESDAVSSMASAIEEMSVATAHISDQGRNAKQIADASRNNTEQGAQVVNKTVSGLLATAQEIETASSEVSRLGVDASRIIDVVKVIKDIADQTNLLALNAAIEAARAGEQGRGFAVVADEVRKLAERTGNATNEINQMSGKISEVVGNALGSMGKVVETTRQGVADAETAQDSIASIKQSFGEVANVIDDISSALAEQNVSSTDLAKNTERVAQMSEENSSSARSLLDLANDLEDKAAQVRSAVEVFKV